MDTFNETIDREPIEICGRLFAPSEILKVLDPDFYQELLRAWEQSQLPDRFLESLE